MILYIVRNMETGNESALIYEQVESLALKLATGQYRIMDSEWVDCRFDQVLGGVLIKF